MTHHAFPVIITHILERLSLRSRNLIRAVGVLLFAGLLLPQAHAESFEAWLSGVRTEAIGKGLSASTLQALDGLTLDQEVLQLAARQPEYVKPPWAYLETMVSDTRKRRGRELLAENKALFDRLEAAFGVDRELLAAIWGIETNFGSYQGKKHILRALATLGHQGGRRTAFGRQQLLAALEIVEAGDIAGPRMLGSWAGAMGQTQFIPTTYLAYAVDFTGDGKRDVWDSKEDALGSAANYLSISGWRDTQRWGYEVSLPGAFDYTLADLKIRKSLSEWTQLGVTGIALPVPLTDEPAALFLPAGYRGPAFLVTGNFRAILRYNTAPAYALAAGILSDHYKGLEGVITPWPLNERPLHPKELRDLQTRLSANGYDTGGVDGMLGSRTKQAIRAFQADKGLVPDGHATPGLLALLP